MLAKYESLTEFATENHYVKECLITIADVYFIAKSDVSGKWCVGKYSHQADTYDVELEDLFECVSLSEAITTIITLTGETLCN